MIIVPGPLALLEPSFLRRNWLGQTWNVSDFRLTTSFSGIGENTTSFKEMVLARLFFGRKWKRTRDVLITAGLLPKASPVQKRIRTPTRALGARRLGLLEEGRALVLVGGGVSALPPPFLKVDSDSTWTCMEEKLPRLLHTLGEGFLPAKNPSASFG